MKRHKHYKDSGVDWLGEVPKYWGVRRLKYSDEVIMGQSPPSSDYNLSQKGLPFLQGNADFSSLHPEAQVWCETANKTSLENDILVSVRAPIGAVNVSDQSFGIGRGLCAIRSKRSSPRFLFYLFLSLNDKLNSIGSGSTYKAISVEDVRNVWIPDIPPNEQTIIANYLDNKTAVLDDIISKKQHLIKLLQEERAAVINTAVTQGLNPDAPRKPSGVPWLGDIPTHWKIKRLKYLMKMRGGYAFSSSDFRNEGIQLIRIGNLYQNQLDLSRQPTFLPKSFLSRYRDYVVSNGDLLMSLTGTLGKRDYGFAILLADNIEYFLNQRVAKLSVNSELLPKFALHILHTESYLNQLFQMPSGTKQGNLSEQHVLSAYVVYPSLKEQNKILEFINNGTARTDAMIEQNTLQLALLQEYRSSLISQVVTGKIDVRQEAYS